MGKRLVRANGESFQRSKRRTVWVMRWLHAPFNGLSLSRNFIFQGEDCTPLILAAKLGHSDIVKLLLKWGSKTDEKDAHGKTALEYAEDGGYMKVAEMIKEMIAKQKEEAPTANGES